MGTDTNTRSDSVEQGRWTAFNPNSHRGGKCPVDPSATVEVNLANGRRLKGRASAMGWELDYRPDGWSILSYRVIGSQERI